VPVVVQFYGAVVFAISRPLIMMMLASNFLMSEY